MRKIAITRVPGRADIELPEFYEKFEAYYVDCELQTKQWTVENAGSDWVYLDCGANIGYYSVLFSQLSPDGRVHAIEPTSTADMLEKNVSHNGCRNVTIHRRALGRYPGRRVEPIFRIWGAPPEEIEYDFTTIDHLVQELNLTRLDCIKIDVDSFDFEVLMGGERTLQEFDPWVIVELNHALNLRGYSNMVALSWLADRGYRQCLVLDYDNFILRRSVPLSAFATARTIGLNFR